MTKQRQLEADMEEIRKGGLLERCRKLETENARLRAALEQVERWMANEDGPIESLWSDGIIGSYEYEDGGDTDWPVTLANVRDLKLPPEQLGTDAKAYQLEEITIYRAVLAALSDRQEGAAKEGEGE
jgi:hypothetical protein